MGGKHLFLYIVALLTSSLRSFPHVNCRASSPLLGSLAAVLEAEERMFPVRAVRDSRGQRSLRKDEECGEATGQEEAEGERDVPRIPLILDWLCSGVGRNLTVHN